jgi:hypothetical protein
MAKMEVLVLFEQFFPCGALLHLYKRSFYSVLVPFRCLFFCNFSQIEAVFWKLLSVFLLYKRKTERVGLFFNERGVGESLF